MDSTAERAESCLFAIGFHRMPKRPHIHVWPEFPTQDKDFITDKSYVLHRCGIAINAMYQEGVYDFVEVEKNRVWKSEKHNIKVKLQGTSGHVSMRIVVIFEKF